jgi:hypothetical protein
MPAEPFPPDGPGGEEPEGPARGAGPQDHTREPGSGPDGRGPAGPPAPPDGGEDADEMPPEGAGQGLFICVPAGSADLSGFAAGEAGAVEVGTVLAGGGRCGRRQRRHGAGPGLRGVPVRGDVRRAANVIVGNLARAGRHAGTRRPSPRRPGPPRAHEPPRHPGPSPGPGPARHSASSRHPRAARRAEADRHRSRRYRSRLGFACRRWPDPVQRVPGR